MTDSTSQRYTGVAVEVTDLTVRFDASRAVRNVSLFLHSGEVLGLVGESGSGKTTLCRAIAGILPSTAQASGSVSIRGKPAPLARLSGRQRSARIGYVFQSPDAALNPCVRIGTQLTEHLEAKGMSSSESRSRATEMLRRMRLDAPDRLMKRYPHEISGGQQQRVCIAIALLNNPDVLILDEPTTALDVTTQAAILDLLHEVLADSLIPTLHVSHDLRVVQELATRVAVMSRGEIVEVGPANQVLRNPTHPYTRALIASQPDLHSRSFVAPPAERAAPPPDGQFGCMYSHRCPLVEDACRLSSIALAKFASDDHLVRCRRATDAQSIPLRLPTRTDRRRRRFLSQPATRLTATGLTVSLGHGGSRQIILSDVDLEIQQARTVAIVGESGAGKTTLARSIVGLAPADAGELRIDDEHLPAAVSKRSRRQLARLQMVFQSSTASLNPQRDTRSILRRVVVRLGQVPDQRADERVVELLRAVQLPETYLGRRPTQLSGGEKQRVAIARALAANPTFVILDEPVSSLDVSVQAALLALLQSLQDLHGMGCLFISHDLSVVAAFADEIIVLYGGKVLERGSAADVASAIHHPYTEVLFRSIPGETPLSPLALRKLEAPLNRGARGCVFANRCPWRIGPVCDEVDPPNRPFAPGQHVRCHYDSAQLARIISSDRAEVAGIEPSTPVHQAIC